jgi:aminoglycoside phosphotransferase family enzyme/predicted kinase
MAAPLLTQGSALSGVALIAALRDPLRYAHPVTRIDVLETHISWVILTGQYTYKIKKPVNLGFLDFTTLAARRRYCDEELRLNRRLAPALYESVVSITGSAENPSVEGKGTAIEYAVKMREFPQTALASNLLADGTLGAADIDALAARIAAFHAHTGVAAQGCPYGTPEAVMAPARDNFTQLDRLLPDPADQARIAELRTWTQNEYTARWTQLGDRHTQGCVRECHGDLHLGNIVMLDGALTPFDCIEFDPALRWIDVMSEIAFLVMDLTDRARTDFASRFLNAYLQASGDFAGLGTLRFYRVYRALVRAKIHALRAAQAGCTPAQRERLCAASRGYVELARRCAQDSRPAIILMHGLSGSGKSVLAQSLAEEIGAIRLRSDVERKRISGLTPLARSDSSLASGLYSTERTRLTYHRLLDLARLTANAGYPVIIDATFLQHSQRDLFRRDAAARGVPFVIVDVTAPVATLRARIAARLAAGGDASEADPAVLTHQLAQDEALTNEESSAVLRIDSGLADVETIQREAGVALRSRLAARES